LRIFAGITGVMMWLTLFNLHAFAQSPVWKITKDGNSLFLGGTLHLLAPSDFPLPSAFSSAYNDSEIIVLETDLQKLEDPGFQQSLMQKSMYGAGHNLKDVLRPEVFESLENHLAERGVPVDHIIHFKPGMVSITLTMIELHKLGLAGEGVDQFYEKKARADSKKLLFLESVNEQLNFLSTMGEGNENELIEYTLEDISALPELFGSMKSGWRRGDIVQLKKIGLDPWIDQFPELYQSILVQRNTKWVTSIEQLLQTKEVEFVLFGALHLAGEEGVLQQLRARGYLIDNI